MKNGLLNKLLTAVLLLLVTTGAQADEDVVIKIKVYEDDSLSFVSATAGNTNTLIPVSHIKESTYPKSVSIDSSGKPEYSLGVYKTGSEFRVITSPVGDRFMTTLLFDQSTLMKLEKVSLALGSDIEIPAVASYGGIKSFAQDAGEIGRLEFKNGGKEYRIDLEVRPLKNPVKVANAH